MDIIYETCGYYLCESDVDIIYESDVDIIYVSHMWILFI